MFCLAKKISKNFQEELQAKSFGKELSRQEFDSLLVSWWKNIDDF